jgi:RNA polymerase sigma-70 factor (ECF subfamily)
MDRLAEFEALRPQLFALAYRALGTRADAEDVVQDAYLRWEGAEGEIHSPKAYLMTIVSRLSLDALQSARRQREQYVGVWLPEPVAGSPAPSDSVEMTESLSMAFLFLLESLQPSERIAFLLREVFGYDYAEVAGILETSEANARQLVSRAKKHVREGRPRFTVKPEQHRAALDRFIGAVVTGDVNGLLGLLREDVVTYADGGGKASAALNPIFGADKVARFFAGIGKKAPATGVAWEIKEAAGAPSLWLYLNGRLESLFSFALDEEGRVETIFVLRNPEKLDSVASPPQ